MRVVRAASVGCNKLLGNSAPLFAEMESITGVITAAELFHSRETRDPCDDCRSTVSSETSNVAGPLDLMEIIISMQMNYTR